MVKKWWLGTTLLETVILFIGHTWLIINLPCFGSIRWVYFIISFFHVVLRAIGYRGTLEMTSEWFRSKKNSNMGLAYAFYLPQIFLMAMHRNYEKNYPYFADSTYSKIFMDYIFISFCMNLATITVICFSKTLYRSKKICIALLVILWIFLQFNINNHHYSYHFACILFVILVFVLSKYFNDCFSFGEYSIFCQALVLSLLIILQKYYWKLFPTKKQFQLQLSSRILLSSVLACFFSIIIYSSISFLSRKLSKNIGKLLEIICLLISFIFLLLILQISLDLKTPLDVFSWFIEYSNSKGRIILLLWWLFSSGLAFIFIYNVYTNKFFIKNVVILRKVFHIFIVICYIPGVILDEELLCIATSGLLWLFCIAECIRLSSFTSMGSRLNQYIIPFLKEGCASWFIIPNHFLLLISVSLPIWIINFIYFGDYTKVLLAHRLNFLLSCIICVGIGDATASIIGVRYGKHKISSGRKTYEGVIASFIIQFIFYASVFRIFSGILSPTYFDFVYFFCSLTTSIIEGLTLQEDNIILPILSISQMIALLPINV
ncbi:hypothetical protein HZS_4855 [Henneguya salminicola]|nr:hypothetical protein HZS_4855 [Henneguya salminicola]